MVPHARSQSSLLQVAVRVVLALMVAVQVIQWQPPLYLEVLAPSLVAAQQLKQSAQMPCRHRALRAAHKRTL